MHRDQGPTRGQQQQQQQHYFLSGYPAINSSVVHTSGVERRNQGCREHPQTRKNRRLMYWSAEDMGGGGNRRSNKVKADLPLQLQTEASPCPRPRPHCCPLGESPLLTRRTRDSGPLPPPAAHFALCS